jgi:hypothetical protein
MLRATTIAKIGPALFISISILGDKSKVDKVEGNRANHGGIPLQEFFIMTSICMPSKTPTDHSMRILSADPRPTEMDTAPLCNQELGLAAHAKSRRKAILVRVFSTYSIVKAQA